MEDQPHYSHTYVDPKLWPASIRYAVLANLCFFVWLGNAYSAGLATGFEELAATYHVSFTALSDLIAWSVFSLGVSNLFWMPTALCIGKRPAVIISMIIFLAGTIWSIEAKSLNSLLGSRILASLGGGSIESLGPSIIADLFFERYFATAMALFAFFLSAGSQVGPLIAGYLIAARGVRWFFILISILIAVNLLTVILFLPETTFRRVVYKGETAAEMDKDALQTTKHNELAQVENVETNAQPDRVQRPQYAGNYWKDLVHFRDRAEEPSGLKAWPKQFSLPFRYLLVPAAVFAACSYGIVVGGIVVISTISPQVLSPPPYLFTSKSLGLSALASFVGIIVAYPIAGPLTDLLSQWMMRANHGIHKPEHRVPALIFPFLIVPPGLIIFAYVIAQHRSFYLAAIGYAMQSAGLVFVPSVVISYVVDAYPESGGEALVLINAGKNLVAFGLSKTCVQWLEKEGLEKMMLELAGVQWAIILLGLPLYFAGPWMRKVSLAFL